MTKNPQVNALIKQRNVALKACNTDAERDAVIARFTDKIAITRFATERTNR